MIPCPDRVKLAAGATTSLRCQPALLLTGNYDHVARTPTY